MPLTNFEVRKSLVLLAITSAITTAVFIFDIFTPLGYAAWVLYFVPVTLSVLQNSTAIPYAVATVNMALIVAGYFFSPPDLAPLMAITNRSLAVCTLFGVAHLSQRVISGRRHTDHLLWIEQGRSEIARSILGDQDVHAVATNALRALARYFEADVGRLYRMDGEVLVPVGGFALDPLASDQNTILLGQGIAGEVAATGLHAVIKDLPAGYMRIGSTLGGADIGQLLVCPIHAGGSVIGILELGFASRNRLLEKEIELTQKVSEKIGVAIRSAVYRDRLTQLLHETQLQSEELQVQQEELRAANEELQAQSATLQESQSLLETQQHELEVSNQELAARTDLLESQKAELLLVHQQMEQNAAALRKAYQYKSQFLANMSHELRTPLNSSLILSHTLSENKTGNLTSDQVRYAQTIHSANMDLLELINDILDLSKVEAGQIDVQLASTEIGEVVGLLKETFEPIARQKQLTFKTEVMPNTPALITTDIRRLQQILKNLLSNAFKFTHEGTVSLRVASAGEGSISFVVDDTGIGIAPEHHQAVFEAFRQADGGTSRRYGGTGLGLSISRELAHLLGGDIALESSAGAGSRFVVTLPLHAPDRVASSQAMSELLSTTREGNAVSSIRHVKSVGSALSQPGVFHRNAQGSSLPQADRPPIEDDRDEATFGRSILIIEDDDKFAAILCDLVREKRFDCLHAPTAGQALALVKECAPTAILLDVGLPDQSGLVVLEQLKRNPETRHIPVHMISVSDYKKTALELGALGYALKPAAREEILRAVDKLEARVSQAASRILIVEDNAALRVSLVELLSNDNTEISLASTVAEASSLLAAGSFDCMVMDLMLPDGTGHDLLRMMAKDGSSTLPPVIVYTGRVLSHAEEEELQRYSQSIIIKGARSPERLLDEVTLFLHRVEKTLPAEKQEMLRRARQMDVRFEGKTFLVAEDDARSIFALRTALEPLGATIQVARNGKEAVEMVRQGRPIDLVLMDIMMPEMDGLAATRKIRSDARYKRLPIIALTAKAMPDDRKACLDAGANDYIAKPVNVDQLVSLCRVWLPK